MYYSICIYLITLYVLNFPPNYFLLIYFLSNYIGHHNVYRISNITVSDSKMSNAKIEYSNAKNIKYIIFVYFIFI